MLQTFLQGLFKEQLHRATIESEIWVPENGYLFTASGSFGDSDSR